MESAAQWNRRRLFRTLAPEIPQEMSRRSELTVARRAMACEFSVVFPFGVRNAVEAGCAALDVVERLEQKLSIYREDSDLTYINRYASERPVRAAAEVYNVLKSAVRLSQETEGAFDAASGALVEAWGFFRGPRRVPSQDELGSALKVSGSRHVRFDDTERAISFDQSGTRFNLGGIGKGYAIDRALRRVESASALMQGGQSSLRALGAPPREPRGWPVDIGSPIEPAVAIARVWLQNRAMGTSGAANQFFEHEGRRYGHVLDPRSGWPAEGVLSATVIAPSALQADALSTAFFVLGVEGTRQFCRKHPEIAAVLVVPGNPHPVVFGKADVEVLV